MTAATDTSTFDIAEAVRQAEERIRPALRETPVERSLRLEELSGVRVWVKLENLQHTGSFKLRGALNALMSLDTETLRRGVVAASTGNHGAAVAYAARQLQAEATIWVPETASPTKLAAIRRLGARIEVHGQDGIESERRARREAEASGQRYVSPYNDRAIVAGQGTVAVELERQLEDFDAVYVAVGGGGLMSGVAGYLSEARPDAAMIGCSPVNSAVMDASVQAGRILDMESLPTLSDGTAGGVEADSLTFEPCRLLVDEWIRVSESEIRHAMLEFIEAHHMLVEGSAGVAIAACLKQAAATGVERAVVIACGGNISLQVLAGLIDTDHAASESAS